MSKYDRDMPMTDEINVKVCPEHLGLEPEPTEHRAINGARLSYEIYKKVDATLNIIDFVRKLPVFCRYAAFVMRGEANSHFAPAQTNIRMMISRLRQFPYFIHEGQSRLEIWKTKLTY